MPCFVFLYIHLLIYLFSWRVRYMLAIYCSSCEGQPFQNPMLNQAKQGKLGHHYRFPARTIPYNYLPTR
jgi:hypothetical protein